MIDETLIVIIAVVAAGVFFFAGLCTVAASLYLFMKQKSRTFGGAPAWMLALAAGLCLTFVVPGIVIFAAAYIIATQTPPPVVTCYAPMPPDYPAEGAIAPVAGALVAARSSVLEKLREQGKISEDVYDKVRGSR